MTSVTSFGKGFSTVSQANGIESIYTNPAGVAIIDALQFGSTYSTFFDTLYSMTSLSIGVPITHSSSLAFHLPVKTVSDIPIIQSVNGSGVLAGTFTDRYLQPSIHLGTYLLPELAVGVAARYHYRELGELTTKGTAFDLGLIVDAIDWTFGATVKDVGGTQLLWSDDTRETIDSELWMGIDFAFDRDVRLSLSCEDVLNDSWVHIGAAYALSHSLTWFMGVYDVTQTSRFSTGASVMLGQMTVHYAYALHDTLGTIHKVGVEYEY